MFHLKSLHRRLYCHQVCNNSRIYLKLFTITNCILYFTVKDKRPFSIVVGKEFCILIMELAPAYKIHSPSKLKALLDTKCLTQIYKTTFKAACHFSITCDIWSKMMTTRSFLGVTIHFIKGTELKSLVIVTKELTERHTASYIGKQLVNIFQTWGADFCKIEAAVTDNGENMVAAISGIAELGKNKCIPCFTHTLNLVAEAVTEDPTVSPLISKVGDISSRFGRRTLKDVKTRWNSTYYIITRYIEMTDLILPILMKDPKSPPPASSSEMEVIKKLMELLKPLEYLTLETVLLVQIEKCFGRIELCHPIACVTLLDPRFKILHFTHPVACGAAISHLKLIIKASESSSDYDNEDYVSQDRVSSYDFWSHHKKLAHGKTKSKKEKR
ncbi:hypothetical protein PR048_019875 [Dryococelus australis]|uniref:Uncharacterized protein n=1 Tax=Dryococelus australis TaxID=614101 RepID=A0ABQ9H4Q7_9NEOP|nr:hypothetical protein PR048_019875 [Dryococelus australis]